MKPKSGLVRIRKRAAFFALPNLALGISAMLFSLTEESFGWTFFVWMAGLEGIAIGLLAGAGYSQVLLGSIPSDWKMNPIMGFL